MCPTLKYSHTWHIEWPWLTFYTFLLTIPTAKSIVVRLITRYDFIVKESFQESGFCRSTFIYTNNCQIEINTYHNSIMWKHLACIGKVFVKNRKFFFTEKHKIENIVIEYLNSYLPYGGITSIPCVALW